MRRAASGAPLLALPGRLALLALVLLLAPFRLAAAPSGAAAPRALARGESAELFGPGEAGARELVTVGRFLAASTTSRTEGTALLSLGVARLRELGSPDPLSEVALGEAAEALCAEGMPLPPGLGAGPRLDPRTGELRPVYDGRAFADALEGLACEPHADASVRERALAGLVRAGHPFPASGLSALARETEAWLDLLGKVRSPRVVARVADRLGESGLALGRLLLAAGKLAELEALQRRLAAEGEEARRLLAGQPRAGRLAARAGILLAMRGDGGAPFPRAAGLRAGSVSIEGVLGALGLVVRPAAGPSRRWDGPLLPVPGSLCVSPTGRFAAWLEVAAPATLTPVVVDLSTGARLPDVSLVAGGRAERDRRRAHSVATLLGFSRDGRRLALSVSAFDDEPPPLPRLSAVDCASGDLLLDSPGTRLGTYRLRRTLGRR